MYPIDTPLAVATQPTPSAAGTQGYFIAADPSVGREGTDITQDWLNMVQGELRSIVNAAGITPSKTNNAQVLAALQAIWGSGAGTNVASGSRVLPGGTVIKWGNGATASTTTAGDAVTFPGGAFPTACASVIVTERNATGWSTTSICTVFGTSAPTASSFTVHCRNINGGTVSTPAGVAYNWTAVGY